MAANARKNRYFLPGSDIAREVITADICRYLGNDALVKPGDHEGRPGYWITAYRALTSEMIADLKADSLRWQQERGAQGARASYQDSQTHRSRHFWGPTPAQGFTAAQQYAGQQQGQPPQQQQKGYPTQQTGSAYPQGQTYDYGDSPTSSAYSTSTGSYPTQSTGYNTGAQTHTPTGYATGQGSTYPGHASQGGYPTQQNPAQYQSEAFQQGAYYPNVPRTTLDYGQATQSQQPARNEGTTYPNQPGTYTTTRQQYEPQPAAYNTTGQTGYQASSTEASRQQAAANPGAHVATGQAAGAGVRDAYGRGSQRQPDDYEPSNRRQQR